MIDIQAKIHDQSTLEFKVGYTTRQDLPKSDFVMNTWIFIPNNLDINRRTYSKEMFYRDVRSNMRLITPSFTLTELAKRSNLPFSLLKSAYDDAIKKDTPQSIDNFESQTKMFASIFKSSLRNTYEQIRQTTRIDELPMRCADMIQHTQQVLSLFRSSCTRDKTPSTDDISVYDLMRVTDEFISNVTEQHLFRLADFLKDYHPDILDKISSKLFALLDNEAAYKKSKNYRYVDPDDKHGNRKFVHYAGLLKKFAESNLYLAARKRHNTFFIEQMAFMFAAGISMTFATIIAFSFQQTFGNFTLPLFIALVVSYMFKDRIKELIRFYFAHKLGSKFYDYKITLSIHNRLIGSSKEGFDYITSAKLPQHVREKRSRTSILEARRGTDEQIILYRKKLHLNRKNIARISQYPLVGVNDIIRINLTEFMRKMDNPEVPIYANHGEGQYEKINARKIYYINYVIQCRYQGTTTEYYRYRVMVGRECIEKIQLMK